MMRLFPSQACSTPLLITADANTEPWSSLQQRLRVKSNSKGKDVMEAFMY